MSRGDPLDNGAVDLKQVPTSSSTDPYRRAWLRTLFSLPGELTIGEPVRFGGSSRSPMMVPILGPSGNAASIVRFEEEREIGNPKALRGALARDANLRGATITNAKVAGDAYYVLCALAKVVGRVDPLAEAAEWIEEYQRRGRPVEGFDLGRRGAYAALDALRRYPYSKRAINLHLAAVERGQSREDDAPHPPLLIDGRTGRAWTSVTHLGTFVRHDRDRPDAISDLALQGRVLEHGCERRSLNVWDRSDRRLAVSICVVGVVRREVKAPRPAAS